MSSSKFQVDLFSQIEKLETVDLLVVAVVILDLFCENTI